MDVVFVDLPPDFFSPAPDWCLGFRSMISVLRANGFSAKIIYPSTREGQSVKESLIRGILMCTPAIVGFSTFDISMRTILTFIVDLRKAGCAAHITLGGLCASAIPRLLPEQCPFIDSVVAGEGEYAVVDLAQRVIRKQGNGMLPGISLREGAEIIHGEPRPLIEDIDALPGQATDDLDKLVNGPDRFLFFDCIPVQASRGCYGNCTFCSIRDFYRSCPGKTWRGREPVKVMREINDLRKICGKQRITFIDENFMGPGAMGREHAYAIAAGMEQNTPALQFNFGCRPNDIKAEIIPVLKRAGLAAVTLGIESMADSTLSLFKKHTTKLINQQALAILAENRIYTEITFIFFHPLTTIDEIRENLEFVRFVARSGYAYFNNHQPFTEFIPFWGTALTKAFTEQGLVKKRLMDYTMIYKDKSVGLITGLVKSIPFRQLARLSRVPGMEQDESITEFRLNLRKYHDYLSMERLPELLYDMSTLLLRDENIRQGAVQCIIREIKKEAATATRLVKKCLTSGA